MSEQLPIVRLDLAGQEFEATPLNSHLYLFIGKTVLESGEIIENKSRNHIFLETEEDSNRGMYIFSPAIVEEMGEFMMENGYHCDVNARKIAKCDEEPTFYLMIGPRTTVLGP